MVGRACQPRMYRRASAVRGIWKTNEFALRGAAENQIDYSESMDFDVSLMCL
jgi:hypothetical protein